MTTSPEHFSMSLDRMNRALTVLVSAAMATVLGIQLALCTGPVAWVPWLTLAILTIVMLPAFALAPTAVEIDGRALRVCRRLWRPLRVALTDIERAETGPDVRLSTTLRLFGVGGFFGTYGLLWVRGLGRIRGYVTRCDKTLVVRRASGIPVLVTPDEPAAVLETLRLRGVA